MHHQIPAGIVKSSTQFLKAFIPSPTPWVWTLRERREAEDWGASEPPYRMKQLRSWCTSEGRSYLSQCFRLQNPKQWKRNKRNHNPLHSMNHQQIEEMIHINKSYQWLERSGLKDSIEALIKNGPSTQEQWRLGSAIPSRTQHTGSEKVLLR